MGGLVFAVLGNIGIMVLVNRLAAQGIGYLATPLTLHFGRICLLTPLLALLSVVGDLSFSIIKRTYGIKDYGNLMPGHGGVLDRFDSVEALLKTVLLTVLVFGVIIILHETGHFLFAKLFHVKVEEFSFGMGPKLWSREKKGTQYSIRAFPIGGYVAMEGEDDAGSGAVIREELHSTAEGDPLYAKPAWQRLIIMVAGAVMNVILGFIMLVVVTAMSGLIGTTTVAVFDENSVSANYLQVGDEIIKVNGYNTRFYGDATFQMLRDEDGVIDFTLIRDGKTMELTVPFETEELADGIIGMHMDFKFLGEPVSFGNTITYAFHWTFSVVKQVWYSLIDVITGRYGLQAISGPVGTATIISQASAQGLRSFLLLVAFITINVGVFNLLPLPALDGGRILFVLIEMIFRKPVPPKYEAWVHRIGIILLLGLIAVVTASDIIKLFH